MTEKKKGIVERTAEEIERQNAEPKKDGDINKDQNYIQEAIAIAEKLKGATTSNGKAFIVNDFLRAYDLQVVVPSKPMPEHVVAFTFDVLDKQVMDFLLNNALNNNISKLLSTTNNCVLVGRFKVLGN